MTEETFVDDPSSPVPGHPSRRNVLRAAAVAGLGAPLLAACGGSSTATDNGGASGGGGNGSSGSGGAGGVLTTTGEVPKGGGVILDQDGIVITQPAAGTFKGFSNICTHQGCPVDNVTNGTINCTCHGSMFSIKDGSVVGGPAPAPLPEKPVTVKGDKITLA